MPTTVDRTTIPPGPTRFTPMGQLRAERDARLNATRAAVERCHEGERQEIPPALRPSVGITLAAVLAAGALALAVSAPEAPPERVVADGRGQVRALAIGGHVGMDALEAAVAADQLARTGEHPTVRCQPAPAPGYGSRAWCAVAGAIDGGSFVRYFEDGSFKWSE